jgi:ABC-type Zn uptake system ZnuABC Zn-binding protein ZnuA
VPLLEVGGRDPLSHDGHAHGIANPHYWLDPLNAETAAVSIAAAIVRLLPNAASTVAANLKRFRAQLHQRLDAWSYVLAPCRGAAVLAYHNRLWCPYGARASRGEKVFTGAATAPSMAWAASDPTCKTVSAAFNRE